MSLDTSCPPLPSQTSAQNSFCGLIAVLGEANAGKSTLVNKLTGEKVSIVSCKPHTTRHGIYGIVCKEETQLIFIDTPGLIPKPKGTLQTFMSRMTKRSTREADVCLVVIDSTRTVPDSTWSLLERVKERPLIIILNKVDAVAKEKLLPLAESVRPFSPEILMISALKEKGLEEVFQRLQEKIPPGPWLFEKDDITQMTQRFWASEMTREKLFEAVHHEVPYHTTVVTDEWKETPQDITIRQTIFIDDSRFRKWILGFEGKRIKRIGHQSRLEMAEHLGKNVHLFLRVEVDNRWFEHHLNPA